MVHSMQAVSETSLKIAAPLWTYFTHAARREIVQTSKSYKCYPWWAVAPSVKCFWYILVLETNFMP